MSSAILYVAIVAIWAGVLIPRWLRRDTSAGEQVSDDTTITDTPSDEERPAPPRPRDEDAPAARPQSRPGGPQAQPRPRPVRAEDSGAPAEEDLRDRDHARVLSARRRLLGLLVALTIGSGALLVTRIAAWWVIVPPSVMLLGYLALLREAAKADAERRERARTQAADLIAKPAAPAAPPAPVPEAEIIEFSAGQGSAACVGQADEEFYDQYADAKLRAVGDLTRVAV